MEDTPRSDVTRLLHELSAGGEDAAAELLPLLYDEIHGIAEWLMRDQRPGHTLQATALVNEAWVRLMRSENSPWESKRHFLAVAARAMRCVLVDHARKKTRQKRKAGNHRLPLDAIALAYEERAVDLIALDESLERLVETDERMARMVELRFFAGCSNAEIAAILEVSTRTVERDWKVARAWLRSEIYES